MCSSETFNSADNARFRNNGTGLHTENKQANQVGAMVVHAYLSVLCTETSRFAAGTVGFGHMKVSTSLSLSFSEKAC